MDDLVVTFIAVTLLILLLVSGIFITLIIGSRQKLRHTLALADARVAYEKELRSVENEVTESVLGRFSRELHDNIGQLLTALQIHVENQKIDHPQLAEGLKPAEIYISEISQQLRLLSRTLNADFVGNAGLLKSLEIEVQRLRALRRMNIHFVPVEGNTNLDTDQEIIVLRIFQEIVQNALRHADADNLYIELDNSGGGFSLTMRDDGKGFDTSESALSGKASGLRNIRHRARLARLDCVIESSPGKGSSFIIRKSVNLI